MLVDTDILIWYLRGNDKARRKLESLNGFAISSVTYMELVQGVRNKGELQKMRAGLRQLDAAILHISEDISARASFLVEQYYAKGLRLADALIGASAISIGDTLLTANTKHYRIITELNVTQFRP